MKKRALISVSNKDGILEFVKKLTELNFEILSTGGTAKYLQKNNIDVIPVESVTDFPEIMDGRVKTLHPKIHGGILALRNNNEHLEQAKNLNITFIDLVCVNLYPFKETLENPNSSHKDIIENIDIGGPSMIRSAAKNYENVIILTDTNDYENVSSTLEKYNDLNSEERKNLAKKAFEHTADYDVAIASYFNNNNNNNFIQISMPLKEKLRYGENPHQNASFFEQTKDSIITQIHGKELSFNNYADIDAALKIILKFDYENACAIIKHTNPSGIGIGDNLPEAYKRAFSTDTLSPFGGIVIVNKELDLETANEINSIFTEIIIAPDFSQKAIEKLTKKKNRRLLKYDINQLKKIKNNSKIKSCLNGILVQDSDIQSDNFDNWTVVTKRKPTIYEMEALKFGWKAVSSLKSNAVCFTTNNKTIGLGIGQTSRIDSTEIAIHKANKFDLQLENTICASDAFFPFRDSVDKIAKYGITAIIQPGGSKGDESVIEACNEYNITMIFTGMRHFMH